MQQNKKQPYLAPAVKVVEVKVERGMQGSPIHAGAETLNGTEEYTRQESTANGWFGSTL